MLDHFLARLDTTEPVSGPKMKLPSVLHFRDRTVQGPWFHLLTADSSRGNLPDYHGHDFPEVLWISAGEGVHRVNNDEQRVRRGSLVLLRATDFHGLRALRGKDLTVTVLSISPAIWHRLRAHFSDIMHRLYDSQGNLPAHITLPPDDLAQLQREARELAGAPHDQFFLERFLINTWNRFLRPGSLISIQPKAPEWLKTACLRIQQPEVYREGVAGLVKASGRTHEHVARETRRWLEKTPSELVNEARLLAAAYELRLTPKPVTQVALDCGFEDPSQFYRLFRAKYGTTPRRYRTCEE